MMIAIINYQYLLCKLLYCATLNVFKCYITHTVRCIFFLCAREGKIKRENGRQ